MKRCLFLLAVLASASALCAQENKNFTREEVLAMFAQYNPSVLEKAKQNVDYGQVLERLLTSYSPAKTEESRLELVALVKNFDYSILLHAVGQAYEKAWLLERVSGVSSQLIKARTQADLRVLFEQILQVTLDVKEIQLDELKKQIKAIEQDKGLDKLDRKERIKVLKSKIKAVKTEIKNQKKNSVQQISSTADAYLLQLTKKAEARFSAETTAAQDKEQKAVSSSNLQIKTKNKKPIAK